MKPGIKIEGCRYYVHKNVVTCVLYCNMNIGYSPLDRIIQYRDLPSGIFEVKGIARCSSDDTFDETIGKRIAESKAKAKAFLKGEAIMHKWIRELENLTSYAQDRANSCYRAFMHEKGHLIELGSNVADPYL